MAEALVNARFGGEWQAFSAGVHPAGDVHPRTVHVMNEIGIDLSRARPKSVDEFRDRPFDRVVTVCDDAGERCPAWLGRGKRAHYGFPDPVKAIGSPDEVLLQFRQVRDAIAREPDSMLGA